MQAKVYKGLSNDKKYPFYYITVNMDYDVTKLLDDSGKPYEFIETINCKGEIKSWEPFLAEYTDFRGKQNQVIFICPNCGSRNCERPMHSQFADPSFFQGNFQCSKCETSGFNYYSDCFISQTKQISLFDNYITCQRLTNTTK